MLLQDSFQKTWLFSIFRKLVSKGEFVKRIKSDQWIVANSEPPIFIDCQEDQVGFVDQVFVPYLLAVKDLNSRCNLFVNELNSLSNNVSLEVGDKVDVMMEQQLIPTTGVVRYIGELPGKKGNHFGIEIMVSQYYN